MANGPFYAEGRYLCEVTDQGLTKASTGTTQFVLRFKVLEGVAPQCDVTQYERTCYLAITEGTIQYLLPKLEALGYTRDSFRYLDPKEANYHSFIGQQVTMFCKHERANDGSTREKWDIARTESKPLELQPVDDKELRKLDMLFGKQLKSARAAAPTARPKANTAATVPPGSSGFDPSDDDIPF